jgi:hypothetical protein
MMSGIALAATGLLLATQLQLGTSYGQMVGWLVLMGSGAGMSFVSMTTASLSEVEPRDAGAASGLINVSQQLGAALGLAVLVTVFGVASGHTPLGGRRPAAGAAVAHALAVVLRGLHDVFGLGVVFTLAALVLVTVGIRRAVAVSPSPAAEDDATGDEWLAETA